MVTRTHNSGLRYAAAVPRFPGAADSLSQNDCRAICLALFSLSDLPNQLVSPRRSLPSGRNNRRKRRSRVFFKKKKSPRFYHAAATAPGNGWRLPKKCLKKSKGLDLNGCQRRDSSSVSGTARGHASRVGERGAIVLSARSLARSRWCRLVRRTGGGHGGRVRLLSFSSAI